MLQAEGVADPGGVDAVPWSGSRSRTPPTATRCCRRRSRPGCASRPAIAQRLARVRRRRRARSSAIEHYGASARLPDAVPGVRLHRRHVVAARRRTQPRRRGTRHDRRQPCRASDRQRAGDTHDRNETGSPTLSAAGVSIWLDDCPASGSDRQPAGADRRLHVVGVTTNPTIFAAALANGEAYDEQIGELAARGADVDDAVREITTDDVRERLRRVPPHLRGHRRRRRPGVASRSTRGWPTTPRPPSPRPRTCGRSSTGPTC